MRIRACLTNTLDGNKRTRATVRALDYYDDAADPEYAAKRIDNQLDPDARIPFYAHVQYWKS